jgi:hypothetical protein
LNCFLLWMPLTTACSLSLKSEQTEPGNLASQGHSSTSLYPDFGPDGSRGSLFLKTFCLKRQNRIACEIFALSPGLVLKVTVVRKGGLLPTLSWVLPC